MAPRIVPGTTRLLDRVLARVAGAWWFPLILTVITLPFLWPMDGWSADHAANIFNPIRIVVYHALFFAFGWRLYRQSAVLAAFGRRAGTFLLIGLAVSFPTYTWMLLRSTSTGEGIKLLALSLYGLTVWLLVLGLIGWFAVRHNRPNVISRYLADSSYWIYLVHYPLIGFAQVVISRSRLPVAVKYFGILAVCLPLLFLSYQTLVRYTVLGRWLNGPRTRGAAAGAKRPTVL
jgi:peptidoglycan/LPS O-acetylase OafA/YrhL